VEDEVFIQPFLENVYYSGVIFTKDPNTGSDYFVINTHIGADTTIVTSGVSNGLLEVIYKSETNFLNNYPNQSYSELFKLTHQLIEILGNDCLDIEFAFCEEGMFILQCRNLQVSSSILSKESCEAVLYEIRDKVSQLQSPNPFLLGGTTYFGIMPDWNPAELIGTRPTQLAISIFKELITDNIWAYERGNLGYKNLRSFPLLLELAGQPYIDVRVSLNSLLPADLSNSISEKLINFYLDKLKSKPFLHDKIESEIVLSAYVFDLETKLEELNSVLDHYEKQELKNSLLKLTSGIIRGYPYGLKNILEKTNALQDRFEVVTKSNLPKLAKIYWLIEDCKRYGTLPFAGAARLAFIATGLMTSLESIGILTKDELNRFFNEIETVAGNMLKVFDSLSIEEFNTNYGHLRPGTFDIRVPRYAENISSYFNLRHSYETKEKADPTNIVKDIAAKIDESEILQILEIDIEEFMNFVIQSIQARENIKFNFSKNISEVLEYISHLAGDYGIPRNDAAHLNISNILNAYRESGDMGEMLERDIKRGKNRYEETCSVWLPPLILSPQDVMSFTMPKSVPNFVTQNSITAIAIQLKSPRDDLENKIVLIESADPGYDWIFTRNIAGLITAYGGANSHMAVRAKELNIPAVIGIGSEQFKKLAHSKQIFIDCVNRRLEGH
jgi:phosphohistidine swiveling domain-containing protein